MPGPVPLQGKCVPPAGQHCSLDIDDDGFVKPQTDGLLWLRLLLGFRGNALTQNAVSGGALRADGKIIAFSIGDMLNDEIFLVHFEKAYAEIQGAYPMINQQFVLHNCMGHKYVDREEDAGVEGLRKAKLSYDPLRLVDKYAAILKG